MHLICANVQIQNGAAAIVAAFVEEENMRLFRMNDTAAIVSLQLPSPLA